MTIGLFLDVDNTLTRGFIQQNYARLVGVEAEYLNLEISYGSGRISSEEFGERIIDLFNRTRFNEQFAADNYSKIRLKDSARPLLKCQSASVKIYFVSSGPNYYVQKLADRYNIAPENVLCSEYTFDRDGKLAECNAVAPRQKCDFRAKHAPGHALTIGVGDDVIHDTSFLDGCTIGLLTPKFGLAAGTLSDNHLWAPKLSLVLALVSNLDMRMKALADLSGKEGDRF